MSDELVAMVEAGMSVKDIATELDISEGTVRAKIKELGLNAHGRAKPAFPIARILEQYASDVPVAQIIAENPGLSYTKFYGILADEGVPTRKVQQQNSRERQLDEAISLYQQGVRIVEIVSETGVAQPTLHTELHNREVPLRKPRKT